MSFAPANDLERALLATSEGASGEVLLAALADEAVLVPQAEPPPGGEEGPLAERVEVSLPLIRHDRERLVPVFTSQERLALGAPQASGALRLTGRALARMWAPGAGMAINPGGELGVALPEAAVRSLLGPGEETIPAGTAVRIGAPAAEPEAAWVALREFAAGHPEIVAAHRALVVRAEEGAEQELVVGLELEEGADAGEACRAVAELLGSGIAVTAIEGPGEGIAGWMLEQDEPIYRRDP